MQNRNIKRLIYHIRHEYLTSNNLVLAVALVIAISWAIASVQAVERNYQLQRVIDQKRRQLQLAELQTDNLQYEQRYYNSDEYRILELKRRLGLAQPGEKVLILPPNSAKAKEIDQDAQPTVQPAPVKQPPFQQWMEFLFGDKPESAQ